MSEVSSPVLRAHGLTPAVDSPAGGEAGSARVETASWSVADSATTYQVAGWGEPYFRINDRGHMSVQPDPRRDQHIDLHELVEDLRVEGVDLPLLLRFPNILEDRIRSINEAFARAIQEYGYKGSYRGVYPVKVNQQRHLVEEVVHYGAPWGFGLEAGSKPELLIAIANMAQREDGFIICNGYKDEQYIETALTAQQLGHTIIIVLERVEELDLLIEASARLAIPALIGVRARLSSRGMGRWANSSGERAKFGLSPAEIITVVDRLRAADMCDRLQLLHFHIGSQVSSITPIKNAAREAANLFTELHRLGCNMRYVDVGGGLAVDYDGSKTDFHASKNYGIQEYAYDVVAGIQAACERTGTPEPIIVSESGRAVAAYQSVLVFEVVGTSNMERQVSDLQVDEHAHQVLRDLAETWKRVTVKNAQESWHDAVQGKNEAQSLFNFGYLNLNELAQAERLFWACCERIRDAVEEMGSVPEELQKIHEVMSAIYFCNFSVFQSAPDIWAIDQLFPMMPIHRLEEKPSVRATLADLTCDSDGMIDQFIDVDDVQRVLPVHPFHQGEDYLLGMFLNGAYQEILGDLHNLFGDTNAVHITLEEGAEAGVEGRPNYSVSHVIKGDSTTDVLRYVQYEPKVMVEQLRKQAERATRTGRMSRAQMRTLIEHYETGLRSYTYLAGGAKRLSGLPPSP